MLIIITLKQLKYVEKAWEHKMKELYPVVLELDQELTIWINKESKET